MQKPLHCFHIVVQNKHPYWLKWDHAPIKMSVLFFRALLSGWENDPPPIRGLKRIKIVQTFSQIILVTLWRDYFDDLCPGPIKHLKRNLLFNTITTCCGSLVPSTPALNSNRVVLSFSPPSTHFSFIIFIFYPLHPNSSMQFLQTGIYTFANKPVKENLFNNQELLWLGDHFFYSHDLNVWWRANVVRRN